MTTNDEAILRFFKRVHEWLIIFGLALIVIGAWNHWPLLIPFGIVIVVAEALPDSSK